MHSAGKCILSSLWPKCTNSAKCRLLVQSKIKGRRYRRRSDHDLCSLWLLLSLSLINICSVTQTISGGILRVKGSLLGIAKRTPMVPFKGPTMRGLSFIPILNQTTGGTTKVKLVHRAIRIILVS